MAINSLKNAKLNPYIKVNNDTDEITIKVMTSPVSEGGNGAQFTDIVNMSLQMLQYLNNKFPSRENALTITKLEEALMWQEKRTKDRVERGVEGKNEA